MVGLVICQCASTSERDMASELHLAQRTVEEMSSTDLLFSYSISFTRVSDVIEVKCV